MEIFIIIHLFSITRKTSINGYKEYLHLVLGMYNHLIFTILMIVIL